MAIKLKHRAKKDPAETTRYLIIGALVVVAFFGAYRFAEASKAGAVPATVALAPSAAAPSPSTAGVAGGGASGGSAASLEGGVQKISVDASQGSYNPSVVQLKAGVPAEITFSQASGCMGTVQSSALGFQEDLSSGPKTVKIKALQPGTYGFACGMNMVQGQVVVQ